MYALLSRFLPRRLAMAATGLWLYLLMLVVLYLALRYELGEFAYWRI